MQITDHQLDKFIEIYQKHFGIELDRESASEKGRKLVDILQIILKENHEKHTSDALHVSLLLGVGVRF